MMLRAMLLASAAALASAGGVWEQLFTPPLFTDNPIPIMMGLACKAKGECFVAGGTPTTGFSVYRVKDEFFRDVDRLTVNSPIPLNVLTTMAMHDSTHAVTGGLGLGVGGTWWTVDGKNFNVSLEAGIMQTQALYALSQPQWKQNGYAFVGSGNGRQGPAISHTGGLTFKGHWWPKGFAAEAPARYGAFPSDNTWYVTGGMWPQSGNSPEYRQLSRRLRVHKQTGRVERVAVTAGDVANYTGVITKTSDGGATWEVLYNTSGKYYLNGIDCASDTVCMAVGEGFAQDGSPAPGVHVLMTTDGSKWSEVLTFGAEDQGSAIAVKMLSETEAWVAATWQKSMLNKGAVMLHTTDGGKTWDQSSTLAGIGDITQMSFIDEHTAYACGITLSQVSTVVCLGCGTPPAPSPGSGSFTQQQCSDANCTQGCKSAAFPQGQCIPTSSGGSAEVVCSADGKSLNTKVYTTQDCTGAAKTDSEPTGQCLQAASGGYFENTCQSPARGQAGLSLFVRQ